MNFDRTRFVSTPRHTAGEQGRDQLRKQSNDVNAHGFVLGNHTSDWMNGAFSNPLASRP
jgi:hypothetical protein